MYLLLCLLPAWVRSQPSSGFSLHHSLPLRAKHLSFVSENKNRIMRQMVLMKTSEYDALRHSYKLVQEASNMPSLVCLKQACLVHYSWPACISVPYYITAVFSWHSMFFLKKQHSLYSPALLILSSDRVWESSRPPEVPRMLCTALRLPVLPEAMKSSYVTSTSVISNAFQHSSACDREMFLFRPVVMCSCLASH